MRNLLMLAGVAGVFFLGAARAEDKKDAFVPKSLEGWECLNEYWSVTDDGSVIGSSEKQKGLKFNTFLCSKKKYKDFEMSFQVRLKDGGGNSGIQIRSKVHNEKTFAVTGPQADIGTGYWGSLYGENFGGMMQAAPKESQEKVKAKDFNDYSIKCVGKKVTTIVNGVTTVDKEFDKMPEDGIIAFQMHGGGPMEVTFKNIVFKDLSAK